MVTRADFPPYVEEERVEYPPRGVRRKEGPMTDMVNSPPHYKQGDIECIEAIEAALTPEEFRGYCKGNALKYIWREQHKGKTEDVKKAAWYLDRLRAAEEKRRV